MATRFWILPFTLLFSIPAVVSAQRYEWKQQTITIYESRVAEYAYTDSSGNIIQVRLGYQFPKDIPRKNADLVVVDEALSKMINDHEAKGWRFDHATSTATDVGGQAARVITNVYFFKRQISPR